MEYHTEISVGSDLFCDDILLWYNTIVYLRVRR